MASPVAPTRDPKSVFVEGRVIGSGFYATRPIQVPSECCATRGQLEFALRHTNEPQVVDENFVKDKTGATLCRHRSDFLPVFVLEETVRPAKHRGQHKAFMTVTWGNAQEIVRWYERNILKGTATKLRVEIHIGWSDQVHLLLPSAAAGMDPDQAWKEYTKKLWNAGLGRGILDRSVLCEHTFLYSNGQFELDDVLASPTTTQNIPAPEVTFHPGCDMCDLARVTALPAAAERKAALLAAAERKAALLAAAKRMAALQAATERMNLDPADTEKMAALEAATERMNLD